MQFEQTIDNLTGYTVVLPAVSVGNVGQLAMDVLLASLTPSSLGQVHHPSLIPLVGPNPLDDSSTSITTAMQLYKHDPLKLVLLQIRSGIVPGKGPQFLEDFVNWCKSVGVSKVIVLTSSHAHERTDQQISSTPLRFLATPTLSTPPAWVQLETRERFPGLSRQETPEAVFIPGGGIAKRLYDKCLEAAIEVAVLLKFSSEGDNTSDGLMLADYLNQWINFLPSAIQGESTKTSQYKTPISWRHLFGNPSPVEMYW